MHGDASMTLFLFLLAFVANLGVGVYSLFLRSQIAGMREAEKQAREAELSLARLQGQVSTYEADRDRMQRDLEFERAQRAADVERLDDLRRTQQALAERINECNVRIAGAASKEAAQGIRGDLSTLSERVTGFASSIDTLSKRVEQHGVATEKSVGGLERRIERMEDHTRKVG